MYRTREFLALSCVSVLPLPLLLPASSQPSLAQTADDSPANPTLTLTATARPTVFRVELANPGPHDLVVNLGIALTNGAKQYPNAVLYTLTTPDGQVLHIESLEPGLIAGRVDPLIEYLPSRASFTFQIDIANYIAFEKKKVWKPDFRPGRYTLQAEYKDEAASQRKATVDARGIPLLPLWKGTVVSPPLTFEIPQ